MTDIDMELKRAFDARLGALTPPPHVSRRGRARRRIVVVAAIAALACVGTAVAVDVDSTAAASGADCADAMAKVKLWAQSHYADLSGADHLAQKQELARIAAATGCVPHDKDHTGGQGSTPKHTAGH